MKTFDTIGAIMRYVAAAHAMAAALQNMLDAYGERMDAETVAEGVQALKSYNAIVERR